MWHIFFTHLSIDEHLGWFHNLAVMNNAVIYMGVQETLLYATFYSFR
jgi:hypothetical protein